jgi:hypothetical protein
VRVDGFADGQRNFADHVARVRTDPRSVQATLGMTRALNAAALRAWQRML